MMVIKGFIAGVFKSFIKNTKMKGSTFNKCVAGVQETQVTQQLLWREGTSVQRSSLVSPSGSSEVLPAPLRHLSWRKQNLTPACY